MKKDAHDYERHVDEIPENTFRSQEQPETHSFIVRVWQIPKDASLGSSDWRGSIDYVGQNKRLYFYRIDAVVHFIWEQTCMAYRQSPSRWRKIRNSFRNWLIGFKASITGEGK